MTKIQGLESLRKKLAALGPATRTEVRAVIQKSADEMVALARALVAPNVDSGSLQMSIRSEPGRHDLAVEVKAGGDLTTREVRKGSGEDYDYALANEFGTSDMAEQPFFWTSYRSVKKRAKGRSTRAIKKAVKRVIAGG